jgi:hypothetical protein
MSNVLGQGWAEIDGARDRPDGGLGVGDSDAVRAVALYASNGPRSRVAAWGPESMGTDEAAAAGS